MKFLFLLFIFIPTFCLSQFKIAIDENFVSENNMAMADDLIEVYRRLGIEVSVDIVPGERAVQKSNSGYYQALDARAINTEVYSSLIPVLEPIYGSFHINAYSLKKLGSVVSYQDLEDYVVAFRRGAQNQKKVTHIVPNLRTFNAPNYEILIQALEKERADVFIMSEEALNVLFSKELVNKLIKLNDHPLEIITTHHHVHESQSHLEPELSRIIREMKDEGRFAMQRK